MIFQRMVSVFRSGYWFSEVASKRALQESIGFVFDSGIKVAYTNRRFQGISPVIWIIAG